MCTVHAQQKKIDEINDSSGLRCTMRTSECEQERWTIRVRGPAKDTVLNQESMIEDNKK